MKGLKMKLKRIFAALIAASVLSASVFSFTPYLPEKDKTESQQTQEENAQDNNTQSDEAVKDENVTEDDSENKTESQDNEDDKGVVKPFRPKDLQYQMFEQILDAYVEHHLYDFTEEEVLHKFFADFLADNPMYFSYFMDYLLGTMDPYSSYYPASSNFLEPERGSTGFGFTIKDSEKGVYIQEVIKGANAEEAGFMAGDRFVSIAGINVENQTFDVVSTLLARPQLFVTVEEETEVTEKSEEKEAVKEEKPLEVEITVDRNGEKKTFSLSKGPMYVSQVSSSVEENNGKPTAYIILSSFLGEETQEEFINLVKKYADDGIKHLTIDLRDNGGGSLDYALAMVETFLEKDELICYYNDKTLEKPTPVYSTTEKVSFDSITILINENTASAAELFTSILKDKGLARVIGTKSFGKSLGQEVYHLVNGDYVTITTYQMLNEKLESYDGIGIYPDLVIEDVEICYTLPSLGVFNHQNFVEIKEGIYSDVTKALEDRLVIMGVLREEYADGIFDEMTKTALYVFQKDHEIEATGYVNYDTVSRITKIINAYKSRNYYDNTQYDVAMIVHHSFSQGKRLVVEKERLREEQSKLIAERDELLEAAYDALHGNTGENTKES